VSAKFEWEGLRELMADLRALPGELTDETSAIFLDEGRGAERDIAADYPERSGNLKNGLRVEERSSGRFGTEVVVRNRSPHAHLFERGTVTRQTSLGANRGSMPAGNVFIPHMIRHRQKAFQRVAATMRDHGLQTSGTAG
jgi:hypothetical protein